MSIVSISKLGELFAFVASPPCESGLRLLVTVSSSVCMPGLSGPLPQMRCLCAVVAA